MRVCAACAHACLPCVRMLVSGGACVPHAHMRRAHLLVCASHRCGVRGGACCVLGLHKVKVVCCARRVSWGRTKCEFRAAPAATPLAGIP
eukprot:366517-Chlamydomonas_euryale.AAC.13